MSPEEIIRHDLAVRHPEVNVLAVSNIERFLLEEEAKIGYSAIVRMEVNGEELTQRISIYYNWRDDQNKGSTPLRELK